MFKTFRKESEIPNEELRIKKLKSRPMSQLSSQEQKELSEFYLRETDERREERDKLFMPSIPIAIKDTDKLVRSFRELLEGNLCIAESHAHISPKKFLIENMRLLKEKGYDVLFMEHLFYEEHQDLVDKYFSSDDEKMPEELAEYLDKLTSGHMRVPLQESKGRSNAIDSYNYRKILEEAKHCGLKVICAEKNKISYAHEALSSGVDRMATFNSNFQKLVKEYEESCKPKKPKWLLFVGNSHVNECEGVPGICNIISDVQDFVILDGEEEKFLVREEREKTFYKINPDKQDDSAFKFSLLLIAHFNNDLRYDKIYSRFSEQEKAANLSLAALPAEAGDYDDLSNDFLPEASPVISKGSKRQLSEAETSASQITKH
jgi:hypothetical protein